MTSSGSSGPSTIDSSRPRALASSSAKRAGPRRVGAQLGVTRGDENGHACWPASQHQPENGEARFVRPLQVVDDQTSPIRSVEGRGPAGR